MRILCEIKQPSKHNCKSSCYECCLSVHHRSCTQHQGEVGWRGCCRRARSQLYWCDKTNSHSHLRAILAQCARFWVVSWCASIFAFHSPCPVSPQAARRWTTRLPAPPSAGSRTREWRGQSSRPLSERAGPAPPAASPPLTGAAVGETRCISSEPVKMLSLAAGGRYETGGSELHT